MLTKEVEPQAIIPTGVYGSLPSGTVGLILGRSSLTMKGFQVLLHVVNSDFTGEIKVIAQIKSPIVQFFPENAIAQILLPFHSTRNIISDEPQGN